MDRMKEQLAALSFAGCRKSFFDNLGVPLLFGALFSFCALLSTAFA